MATEGQTNEAVGPTVEEVSFVTPTEGSDIPQAQRNGEEIEYVDAYFDEDGLLHPFEDEAQTQPDSPGVTIDAGDATGASGRGAADVPPPQRVEAGVQESGGVPNGRKREAPPEDPPRPTKRAKAGRATTEGPG